MNLVTAMDISSSDSVSSESEPTAANIASNSSKAPFPFSLEKGDKIDVYDEEMDCWDIATLQHHINPGTKQISFIFNPSIDPDGLVWESHIYDIDIAPYKTHTVHPIPLPFPYRYYVHNDTFNTYFDTNIQQHIIVGLKPMSHVNKAPYLLSQIPSTQYVQYNIMTNTLEPFNIKQFPSVSWTNDAALFRDLNENIFSAHNITQYISTHGYNAAKTFSFSFKHDPVGDRITPSNKHHCNDVNKIYIARCNELHIITHNLCDEHSYHIRCDLTTMSATISTTFGRNHPLLYDGTLCYVSATHWLMYFGGKRSIYQDDDDISHDIWYYDLSQTLPQWKIYSLQLEQRDNTAFNVIVAGELIFVFYYNSRDIYIYDLSSVAVYKLSKQYPSPYKGKSVAIKTCDDMIHFMNAAKVYKELHHDKCCHFSIDLKELVPRKVYAQLNKRYSTLIHRYVAQHMKDRFCDTFSLFLKSIIQEYVPIFL